MKLFIDHADTNAIRRLIDLYPIDGVTTNPSILAHAGRDPRETLAEIRGIIGEDALLFAQALALDAEGMVKDAKYIISLCGKNTVVKLPSIPEGFKAMRLLKQEGITTCGTVVYTPMQALLAAKSGASYVADSGHARKLRSGLRDPCRLLQEQPAGAGAVRLRNRGDYGLPGRH